MPARVGVEVWDSRTPDPAHEEPWFVWAELPEPAADPLATSTLLGSVSRAVSLVDWMSFVVMRAQGIDRAFVFDADFAHQGFRTIPG